MNNRKEKKKKKKEMDKLLIEVNYQKKAEFKDNDLNNFYNYWWCFEKKENEIQNEKNISIDSVLYTKYYWCTRYKEKYEQLYGFDAGIEQQQYKIIEEMQIRLTEYLDWNTINLIEQNKI